MLILSFRKNKLLICKKLRAIGFIGQKKGLEDTGVNEMFDSFSSAGSVLTVRIIPDFKAVWQTSCGQIDTENAIKVFVTTFLNETSRLLIFLSHKLKSRRCKKSESKFVQTTMKFLLVFLRICLIYCDKSEIPESISDDVVNEFNHSNDDYPIEPTTQDIPEITTDSSIALTTLPYFFDMPEAIKIIYIDPITLIKFDNKGEKMMGVSDDKCDNGRVSGCGWQELRTECFFFCFVSKVNIEADFDPFNKTLIDLYTKCHEASLWLPDMTNLTDPILTIMNVPSRYIPIHKCTYIKINYIEPIPTIGPHRPLWARYGEYTYLPTQRWLHNVEHGEFSNRFD